MKVLKILRNYFFYCGIEKEEYDAIKKDVYASNYIIWRILHFFMAFVFLALYISSLMNRRGHCFLFPFEEGFENTQTPDVPFHVAFVYIRIFYLAEQCGCSCHHIYRALADYADVHD